MARKILVAGGAGFIGSNPARELVNRGYNLLARRGNFRLALLNMV